MLADHNLGFPNQPVRDSIPYDEEFEWQKHRLSGLTRLGIQLPVARYLVPAARTATQ
jgi:hypothetical protein